MTPAPRNLPRRTVLAASGTAVLAAAAACSSSTTPTTTTRNQFGRATSSAAASVEGSHLGCRAPLPRPTHHRRGRPDHRRGAEAAPTGTPLASVADVEAAGR